MHPYDSRDLLIYLAVKYEGDYSKILTALHLKEDDDISPDAVKKACSSLKCKTITLLDYDYPKKLKMVYHPPIVLFYYGDISLLDDNKRKYGVVGSRACSDYGIAATNKIVSEMARGTILVSGMARGIDTVGHLAQINNGGRTIAVLGSGIDNCYPPENKELYEKLKKEHLVISEYPNNATPDGVHFPQRNRIVTGLSDALIVPQINTYLSGTMISINMMMNLGRPVFFVPNPITEETINNKFLQEGADFAESGRQILEDMKWD